MIKNLTFGKILMEVYHKNGEIMDKKKFVIFVLIVVFVSLCFWWHCWKYSPPRTESSLERYNYYTGEIPPRKGDSTHRASPSEL